MANEREWYEKSHSFRLTKNDINLYLYLQSFKGSKSKKIREMLLFALEHMETDESVVKEEMKKKHQVSDFSKKSFISILKKLDELEDLIKSSQIEPQSIENKYAEDKGEDELSNKSVENTNDTLFNAWGVDF